ncbi:MAG: hypothetical protein A2X70_05915 [Alphaproteobacteria bacterium GWC2_42_16]|nr:MAG: hypothetical protein A2X70_05915 [Alphaproteobacteria bacterium GWC2_42_16]OFW73666.1 MAG: hypothetical protein A2Z80_02245 [Alphaproteobacteria bacterium GWA2_41_27]OFW81954.1 MAG: hypothetical protein A3E50_02050 [Alphaproteobacteria bacterium RIFCSPHIGHO2_12_FULL_42_100]OFW85992.1 MAG: hypothetical protein A2W06_00085 [Alphaproteobacteria bacterium RBG_16_42_14]OFW91090.1 MAG: hypothetical protein A3C41_05245 [Alphaproteobacteria bacterium RIFCSPHIGHO2_02_FULL_42_30]OFW93578.1 MAG: 
MMHLKPSPSVSILMSVYNGAAYLWTSLSAICDQDRFPDEIILVDDGSTDNTLKVMESFQREFPQIKIIKNKKNLGLVPSINKALRKARGDYIVWCAADDFLLPNFLKRSLEVLEGFPPVGLCFSQFAIFVDDPLAQQKTLRLYNSQKMGKAFDLGDKPHYLSPEKLFNRLRSSYLWVSGNTALVRRDSLIEIGGFPEGLAWHADWFSFYIIALKYGICMIPEYLTLMREVPKSYSRNGMNHKQSQVKILTELLRSIFSDEMRDVSHIFKKRLCLFTPFNFEYILCAMLKERHYILALRHTIFILRERLILYSRLFRARMKKYR